MFCYEKKQDIVWCGHTYTVLAAVSIDGGIAVWFKFPLMFVFQYINASGHEGIDRHVVLLIRMGFTAYVTRRGIASRLHIV